MRDDIESILFDEQTINEKITQLGDEISKDYAGKHPLLIGVLKGSAIFMADLARKISVPCEFDFMRVTSYGNSSKTTGAVKILKDVDCDVTGRDIIIVEDILDSGLTLKYLMEQFQARKCNSIKICTLLEKPDRHLVDVKIDYLGFVVDDIFVVGYGLDYAEKYRNLPYIGILKECIYTT